jgi:hypothetical protein
MKTFTQFQEDAPVNAVGGGGVAGIGFPEKSAKGEPGVDLRKRKKEVAAQAKEAQLAENSNEWLQTILNKIDTFDREKTHPGFKWSNSPQGYERKAVEFAWNEIKSHFRNRTLIHGEKLAISKRITLSKCETFKELRSLLTGMLKEEHNDSEYFAGARVFEVDMDRWMKSRNGKNRYHRYSKYVGEDAKGEEIRQHGRSTKEDIILKDEKTAVMTYLRRKKPIGA